MAERRRGQSTRRRKATGRFALHGNYLITRSAHLVADSPEIFIVVREGAEHYGICVNQQACGSDGKHLTIADVFRDSPQLGPMPRGFRSTLPALRSAKDAGADELFVLHTSSPAELSDSPDPEKRYRLTPAAEFLRNYTEKTQPFFYMLSFGRQKFEIATLLMMLFAKAWELRSGQHALAYGMTLSEKMGALELLDPLQKNAGENKKSARQIFGMLFEGFHEAQTAAVHAGVEMMLRAEHPELSARERLRVIRAAMVIKERDGGDLMRVLKKYTHQRMFEIYDREMETGAHFKLLEAFDRRHELLTRIGVHPFMYDLHIASMFVRRKNVGKPMPGPAEAIRHTLKGVASLLRAPKA